MKRNVRGVLVTHDDFQGDTAQAVTCAKTLAEMIYMTVKTQFEKGVTEARQEARKQGKIITDDMAAEQFEKFTIKVVKVDI
jgi:hypothetical protein